MSDFLNKRRQQFITESYFTEIHDFLTGWLVEIAENLQKPELGTENLQLEASRFASQHYELLSLHYTAGTTISSLRPQLEIVVSAYENYQNKYAIYAEVEDISPLGFAHLSDYEQIMQLISLCYLLHRRDLLPRLAALFDPGYIGEDTLYEDLLAFELEGRYDVDEWYHDKPYRDLINALYSDTPEESVADIKKYLKAWYPAMKKCPWHDSHLRMTETDGDYFGYWAFEAGAVAYLLELDDSEIDHMVYPKDLVAFAREFVPDEQPKTENRKGE